VRGGTVSGNINSFIVLIDSFVGNVNERKAPIGLEGVIPLLGHHTGCPSITGHRRSIFQGRTGNGTGGFLLAKVPILARQAGCPGFSAYARLEQATHGSSDYQAPFPFEGGIIKKVVVDVGNDRYLDICDRQAPGRCRHPGRPALPLVRLPNWLSVARGLNVGLR
jgi:hypothetical protein